MAGASKHLADLLRYAAGRRGHDRADAATEVDLRVPAAGLGLPDGLELRWLGVAGFVLAHQGVTVVIDPYVRRVPLADMLRRRVRHSDPTLLDRWVPKADAILLGHTHFDHALDAPALARRDGATVYGSASAKHLLGLWGLADQAVEVEAHQTYEIGPFEVSFVPSVHSKLFLGRSVPNGGELTCEHVGELTPQAYCCGQVWGIAIKVAGITLYHQGSADVLEDQLRHREVDVFLCGVAGRQFTPDYLQRILPALQPRQIVMTHHDDFFNPLGGPLGFAFGVDLARFPDEVAAITREPRVVTLPEPQPVA